MKSLTRQLLQSESIEVLEVMYHWLDKGKELYNKRVQNARRLGYPQAACEVAELVWIAAKTPATSM